MMLDVALADAVRSVLPDAFAVRGCTSDHVITRAPERAAVGARFDADVVDMESAALASGLAAQGVRFAIVRVVSDDATRDLPALEHAIDAQGNLNILRVAAAFVRDPRGAAAFARDAARALRRLRVVATALGSLRA